MAENRGRPSEQVERLDKRTIDSTDYDGSKSCLLYTSPSPRDRTRSRMPSSA